MFKFLRSSLGYISGRIYLNCQERLHKVGFHKWGKFFFESLPFRDSSGKQRDIYLHWLFATAEKSLDWRGLRGLWH